MDNINEIAAEAALANAGTESVSHFAFELDNNNEGLHELAPGNGPISVAVSTRTFTDEEFGYATFQMIFGDADDELLQGPLMQNDDDRSTNNTPQPPPTAPNTPINFGALDAEDEDDDEDGQESLQGVSDRERMSKKLQPQ
ncbi:uncharacterized protein LOC117903239 [Drosophila subobscura]|uniref:uncharacterized protein LOC117903239 n=1 Tax=Drosophila subobscura TaxID=7241 RepID=UPI00155B0EDF|nr:uncharacterized protein LOC117903239 [Drosophila subobscura]